MTDSNRRHTASETVVLPTELIPLTYELLSFTYYIAIKKRSYKAPSCYACNSSITLSSSVGAFLSSNGGTQFPSISRQPRFSNLDFWDIVYLLGIIIYEIEVAGSCLYILIKISAILTFKSSSSIKENDLTIAV